LEKKLSGKSLFGFYVYSKLIIFRSANHHRKILKIESNIDNMAIEEYARKNTSWKSVKVFIIDLMLLLILMYYNLLICG